MLTTLHLVVLLCFFLFLFLLDPILLGLCLELFILPGFGSSLFLLALSLLFLLRLLGGKV